MKAPIGDKREERAAARRSTMAPSTLRAANRAATDVTVVDLSQTGIRIASDAELAVGDEISIGLSGVGTRRAYVAWRRAGEYGCAFDKPLGTSEMSDAFTSASVIRLGTVEEMTRAVKMARGSDLAHLYGQRMWNLPADALLAIAIYLSLFGWAIWHFLLAR